MLAQANGQVGQRGAVADYLEVDAGYERAVEACLGDLLQHIIVERPEQAAAGFELVREQRAGRCGFLIASEGPAEAGPHNAGRSRTAQRWRSGSASRCRPSHVPAARSQAPSARPSATRGSPIRLRGRLKASRTSALPVATTDGELFRGAHLVSGGSPEADRGILETKRAIKDLRARIESERDALARVAEEAAAFEALIAQASAAIAALNAEHHRQEKAMVGLEAQLQRADAEESRLGQKHEQLSRERRQAEEERESLDRRQEEARASIASLEHEQRVADEQLTVGAAAAVRSARRRRGFEQARSGRGSVARRARRARDGARR